MEDVEVTLNLGESMSFKSKTKGKEAIIFTLDYSESSQLEDIEYYANMENVSETEREKYKEKNKKIKEKIKEKNRTEM